MLLTAEGADLPCTLDPPPSALPLELASWNDRLWFRVHSYDPETVVEVIDVREAVLRIHHDAPIERDVLLPTAHVGSIQARDLATLRAQIASQLARDVEHVEPGVVGAEVERVF